MCKVLVNVLHLFINEIMCVCVCAQKYSRFYYLAIARGFIKFIIVARTYDAMMRADFRCVRESVYIYDRWTARFLFQRNDNKTSDSLTRECIVHIVTYAGYSN